jgi:hypothetical protein
VGARRPPAEQRRAALATLVQVAATGARAASYAPYLGADLPGTGTTVFRYAFAPVEATAAVRAPLEPRPGPIALTGVALASSSVAPRGVAAELGPGRLRICPDGRSRSAVAQNS